MGAEQSTALPVEDGTAPADSPGYQAGGGVRLYKFQRMGNSASWNLESNVAHPNFYNLNEDSASSSALWYMELDESEVDHPVSADLKLTGSANERRVTFIAGEEVYALKFPTKEAYVEFYEQFNAKLFENTYGMEHDEETEAKIFGEDYSHWARGQDGDADWTAEPMATEESYSTPAKTPSRYREREVAHVEDSPISQIRIGANDKSFLVRGSNISVLNNSGSGVEYTGNTFQVTPAKGPAMTPSQIMLTHGERYMNLLSPAVHSGVFHTDIETGKCVSEWRFEKDGVEVPMKGITNDTKSAQLDERDTFLGLDSSRLCRWDMRDPHGVVQDLTSPSVVSYKTGKDYAGKPRFNSMATSGEGYVVVGSEDGTVRLYNNTDKGLNRASTSFPSLGAPVTAVDVTFDAEWIVATTDTYLMIIRTSYNDPKNGKATHGFKGRMGKNACAPRLLRLKPEDWQLAGKGAKLEKGKFTWITEQGSSEHWIVASCGNFSVLWNFTAVKQNKASDSVSHGGLVTCTTYNIIPKDENVVDSVFLHEGHNHKGHHDSSLVVATRNYLWACAEDDEEYEEE